MLSASNSRSSDGSFTALSTFELILANKYVSIYILIGADI